MVDTTCRPAATVQALRGRPAPWTTSAARRPAGLRRRHDRPSGPRHRGRRRRRLPSNARDGDGRAVGRVRRHAVNHGNGSTHSDRCHSHASDDDGRAGPQVIASVPRPGIRAAGLSAEPRTRPSERQAPPSERRAPPRARSAREAHRRCAKYAGPDALRAWNVRFARLFDGDTGGRGSRRTADPRARWTRKAVTGRRLSARERSGTPARPTWRRGARRRHRGRSC